MSSRTHVGSAGVRRQHWVSRARAGEGGDHNGSRPREAPVTDDLSPDRMHAISDETRATVDDVLDYARRRAVYEDIPLDKPLTPRDLSRLASGSITRVGHRRAPRDSTVRERPRAGVRDDRPPGLPVVHPVGADEGRDRVRPRRVGILHLRRIVDGGLRRGLRRERGAALARRGVRPAPGRRRRLHAGRHDRQPLGARRRRGMPRAGAIARPGARTPPAGRSCAAPRRTRRSSPRRP